MYKIELQTRWEERSSPFDRKFDRRDRLKIGRNTLLLLQRVFLTASRFRPMEFDKRFRLRFERQRITFTRERVRFSDSILFLPTFKKKLCPSNHFWNFVCFIKRGKMTRYFGYFSILSRLLNFLSWRGIYKILGRFFESSFPSNSCPSFLPYRSIFPSKLLPVIRLVF